MFSLYLSRSRQSKPICLGVKKIRLIDTRTKKNSLTKYDMRNFDRIEASNMLKI